MVVYIDDILLMAPCKGSPERLGAFTGQSGVYHQSDQVNNFSCPTARVSEPSGGLDHITPESAGRKASPHKGGGGVDTAKTVGNSLTSSPDNRETECNITGSSPSPLVLPIPTRGSTEGNE